MQDFRQIKAWQKAHAFVLCVYVVSDKLPSSENFGLTANLRRSAVATPRAIAEGSTRASGPEFAADSRRARAAAAEVEDFLLLCRDLDLMTEPLYMDLQEQLTEVAKMISGLLRTVAAPAELVR